MKTFQFERDPDNKWYVVLPEWEGAREELEMVCGADIMLDIVAQGRDLVSLSVSLEPIEDWKFQLFHVEDNSGGADYMLFDPEGNSFPVWLCQVVVYVYGRIPRTLYIN